ncbi:MAG: glycine cleavage system protein GcvH [Pseudomonadales bacterium]|nr:glycine cleavage system protein GcvH [Pseudomonadales bacterium]
MSELPAELKFLSSHEWARVEGDIVTVGISDHAQESMGDLVFVELPDVGADLHANDEAGVVESVKAASDIYTPVTGKVLAINEDLEDAPELVNKDPYHDGWLFQIKFTDAAELDDLLSSEDYQAQLDSED